MANGLRLGIKATESSKIAIEGANWLSRTSDAFSQGYSALKKKLLPLVLGSAIAAVPGPSAAELHPNLRVDTETYAHRNEPGDGGSDPVGLEAPEYARVDGFLDYCVDGTATPTEVYHLVAGPIHRDAEGNVVDRGYSPSCDSCTAGDSRCQAVCAPDGLDFFGNEPISVPDPMPAACHSDELECVVREVFAGYANEAAIASIVAIARRLEAESGSPALVSIGGSRYWAKSNFFNMMISRGACTPARRVETAVVAEEPAPPRVLSDIVPQCRDDDDNDSDGRIDGYDPECGGNPDWNDEAHAAPRVVPAETAPVAPVTPRVETAPATPVAPVAQPDEVAPASPIDPNSLRLVSLQVLGGDMFSDTISERSAFGRAYVLVSRGEGAERPLRLSVYGEGGDFFIPDVTERPYAGLALRVESRYVDLAAFGSLRLLDDLAANSSYANGPVTTETPSDIAGGTELVRTIHSDSGSVDAGGLDAERWSAGLEGVVHATPRVDLILGLMGGQSGLMHHTTISNTDDVTATVDDTSEAGDPPTSVHTTSGNRTTVETTTEEESVENVIAADVGLTVGFGERRRAGSDGSTPARAAPEYRFRVGGELPFFINWGSSSSYTKSDQRIEYDESLTETRVGDADPIVFTTPASVDDSDPGPSSEVTETLGYALAPRLLFSLQDERLRIDIAAGVQFGAQGQDEELEWAIMPASGYVDVAGQVRNLVLAFNAAAYGNQADIGLYLVTDGNLDQFARYSQDLDRARVRSMMDDEMRERSIDMVTRAFLNSMQGLLINPVLTIERVGEQGEQVSTRYSLGGLVAYTHRFPSRWRLGASVHGGAELSEGTDIWNVGGEFGVGIPAAGGTLGISVDYDTQPNEISGDREHVVQGIISWQP